MTTDTALLARPRSSVKPTLMFSFERLLDELLDLAEGDEATPRSLEIAVWGRVLPLIRALLTVVWGTLCRRSSEADIARRGLTEDKFTPRMGQDYWVTRKSTAGPVPVPLFAYREHRELSSTTHSPARTEVFPLHGRVRSSELLLEWENRLGSRMPFREAEELLGVLTHGAVHVEDNTINAHMTAIGAVIDSAWLYRPPEQIRVILRDQAARNFETGQPIIYVSSDAHALRQLVNETWEAAWKMANGLRLWCIDRRTGAVIHLGGEYTWGDCQEVRSIFEQLRASGHLPAGGDYGEGVVASVSVVMDGLEWLREHVLALFGDGIAILDAQHARNHLRDYAAALWGRGTRRANAFLNKAYKVMLGRHRRPRKPQQRTRKGHKKQPAHVTQARKVAAMKRRKLENTYAAEPLLALLADVNVPAGKSDEHDALVSYIEKNADRMDYAGYAARGYQLGSGAMESLHRTASQIRIKRPGPGWLKETSQAVFNLRMLDIVGRWDEFWDQQGLTQLLGQAFDLARVAHA